MTTTAQIRALEALHNTCNRAFSRDNRFFVKRSHQAYENKTQHPKSKPIYTPLNGFVHALKRHFRLIEAIRSPHTSPIRSALLIWCFPL
jgi:hypothetical protein